MSYHIVSGSAGFGLGVYAGFGKPSGAAAKKPTLAPFTFVCGLLPTEDQKKKSDALRKSVLAAINLARGAAAKLEVPNTTTKNIFKDVFGEEVTDDWEKPCCAREKIKSRSLALSRFHRVQKELETRKTRYVCLSQQECANKISLSREERPRHPTNLTIFDDALNAFAVLCNDEVFLCPPFWQQTPDQQAGTILHEMFHLVFGVTCDWFQHDNNERPRNSAYCYEVFALRVAGKSPGQASIDKCKDVLQKSRNSSPR